VHVTTHEGGGVGHGSSNLSGTAHVLAKVQLKIQYLKQSFKTVPLVWWALWFRTIRRLTFKYLSCVF